MHTTITVNGRDGLRFLSSVDHTLRFRMPLPRALEWLLTSERPSIEVPAEDADQVAAFIEHVEAQGWITGIAPPLLFSPQLGEHVVVVRDALLELQVERRHRRTWVLIARGTVARLIARHDGVYRLVLGDGPYAQEVAFAGERTVTRARAARLRR